jgi:hypothetical protein
MTLQITGGLATPGESNQMVHQTISLEWFVASTAKQLHKK